MRNAGDVIRADVELMPDGRSKGYGVVEYATAAEAQSAIETLSESQLLLCTLA